MAKRGDASERTLDMWRAAAVRARRSKWVPIDGERTWALNTGGKTTATITVDRGTGATAFIATVRGDVRTCWSMAEAATWCEYKLSERA